MQSPISYLLATDVINDPNCWDDPMSAAHARVLLLHVDTNRDLPRDTVDRLAFRLLSTIKRRIRDEAVAERSKPTLHLLNLQAVARIIADPEHPNNGLLAASVRSELLVEVAAPAA